MAYNSLTRPIRYSDIVRRRYPGVMERYFADKEAQQRRDALVQNAMQFDEQMRIRQQMAEDQAEQQQTSNLLSGAGTLVSAYPYLKKGAKGLYNLGSKGYNMLTAPSDVSALGPESGVIDMVPSGTGTYESAADFGVSELAPIATDTGYVASPELSYLGPESGGAGAEAILAEGGTATGGLGSTAGELAYLGPESGGAGFTAGEAGGGAGSGVGAGAGGGLSWWGGPVIAAATLAQMGAAGASDPVEGVAPGHAFTVEDGNWKPRFAEPDKLFFSQQWGGGNTTGSEFDSRLQRGDIGGAARAFPGFLHGISLPGVDVAGNVASGYASRQLGDRAGREVGYLIDPISQTTGRLSEAEDIGDAATAILTGGRGDSIADAALSIATGGVGGDK